MFYMALPMVFLFWGGVVGGRQYLSHRGGNWLGMFYGTPKGFLFFFFANTPSIGEEIGMACSMALVKASFFVFLD